jgi:hypothetical protein
MSGMTGIRQPERHGHRSSRHDSDPLAVLFDVGAVTSRIRSLPGGPTRAPSRPAYARRRRPRLYGPLMNDALVTRWWPWFTFAWLTVTQTMQTAVPSTPSDVSFLPQKWYTEDGLNT